MQSATGTKWFQPNVTIGNIVTFCTILVMVAIQYGTMTTRMAAAEERIRKTETSQDETKREIQTVKERVITIDVRQQEQTKSIEEMKKTLDQINTKLSK